MDAALISELQDMRLRNAILVTALVRLGGQLEVSPKDVSDAAAHDVQVQRTPACTTVSLRPAPG